MFLLILAGFWVLMLEDKVNLERTLANTPIYTIKAPTLFVAPHLSGPNMMT